MVVSSPSSSSLSMSNGSTKRVGGGLPYTDGCRILHFTNSTRAFEYGLLVQNATTREKAAFAKFGTSQGRSILSLYPGHYVIKYKVCNWNQPEFTPVTVAIEDTEGQEVASETVTPTVNIGNKTGNKFTGVQQQAFEFDIAETGDYVVAFYTGGTRNADFVLGQLTIIPSSFVSTGINENVNLNDNPNSPKRGAFDLSGRRLSADQLKRGIYIIDGRKTVVR